MGVYIKGMEMPSNCGECFACKAELSREKKVIHVCCFTRKEYGYDGSHMDDCPLAPVLPHGRLIDADKLKSALWNERLPVDIDGMLDEETAWRQGKNAGLLTAQCCINNTDTIIPADYEPNMDEAMAEFAQYCEMYEPTYDPDTGAM